MKQLYKYLFLILIVASFSSCRKWLDLQPQDGITKAEFWKTKEDVKAALTGIYSSLNAGDVEERIFLWGELRGDMVVPTSYAADDYRLVKNMNILSTNDISDWSALYVVINNCNLLIDFAKDAKALDPTFTDELYNAYLGEALTIRSLMYFYLVRTFRDIPLKLNGSYKDTDVKPTPQSTPEAVISQLISDLTKAQVLVPDFHVGGLGGNIAINPVNTGRVTKPAVTALLADVYLWNEQYDKAGAETDKILATGRYQLLGNSNVSIFNGSTSETIFEISHKDSRVNPLYGFAADTRKPFAANNMLVNTDIFTPNTEGDLEAVDTRGEGYMFNTSGAIYKFGFENPSYYNFQVYRLPEIMLIKADAANETGNGGAALSILNILRTARGALQATQRDVDSTDVDGINRFISEERARELSFEGKRWFDLLRLAKKNNYSNLDVLVDVVSKTVDVAVQQSAINKINNLNSHYLPISETELFKDTALKQNPFYSK
ncbi:MAG TPA: RagB/SusD family nutrient uptake outer membrane protein [Niabella sp.]|nr:RagB/SusD family nutrient uptake outer membrane protein [Niabella sp.]HQW13748.1 RagB/SusD family nutrient uptake outer membrane protein [Niabella sp.]HQX19143.1 RagB/SusD family nutrient uptake outer membrane protein [Niabella sp.]HQX42056.1 RagB/SusD family nutrient uptake outer membrane protein [Niabella sp.]HRB06432.1 RagB/SusD family nutrient uptake outer membrane protein [Niabella sp.]